MTSENTFPQRLTRIDDLTRLDHHYLTEADACYFIGEYTARRGYAYSHTNSLISNFKKPMDRRGLPEWPYKTEAIQIAALAFRRALKRRAECLTFVPMPPSKARGDTLYDDRLTQMLNAIRRQPPLDVRELLFQTESTAAAHANDERPGPAEIAARYRVDEELTEPTPGVIAIVDDILTTGAHFRAAATILSSHFPAIDIIGLFVARRVPGAVDPEKFDDIEP